MEPLKPASSFHRRIYRMYWHGSAFKYILTRLIRPAGGFVLLFSPLPWLLLPLHDPSSIWLLRVLLLTLPVVGLSSLIFRRGKVYLYRDTPRLATAGEKLTYQATIQNQGNSTLRGASIIEVAADNRPSLSLFSHSREPNEETRNSFDRKLCYYRWEWLQGLLTLFESKPSDTLPPIKPGDKKRIQLTLTPLKRGVIELSDIRLFLHDPLGLFQRCKKMPSSTNKIIVLPRRYRIPPFQFPGDARFQIGGDSYSSSIGQSGDFTSIREYKPGDPIKDIHWKSWARTGKPIVKEYEDSLYPRYGLVLDTLATADHADSFEDAVSVAASFASNIDTQKSLLDLMFIKNEAFTFGSDQDEGKAEKMLEILAGVSCSPDEYFNDLLKLIMRHQKDLSACICIFTGWSEQRRDFVAHLHQSNLSLHIIIVCADIDEAQESHHTYPAPVNIHWIRQGHLQQDLQSVTTN